MLRMGPSLSLWERCFMDELKLLLHIPLKLQRLGHRQKALGLVFGGIGRAGEQARQVSAFDQRSLQRAEVSLDRIKHARLERKIKKGLRIGQADIRVSGRVRHE